MMNDLERKIGQLIVLGFEGCELLPDSLIAREIAQGHVGGVILFDYNFRTKRFSEKNIVSTQQLKKLTSDLKSYAEQASLPKLLISVDYEGGKVNRLHHRYGFPNIVSAEESCQLTGFKEHCQLMACTLKQHGFNINFAPVVDLLCEGSVIANKGRCFHSDSLEIFNRAQQFIESHHANGISGVLKHFPGQGSAQGDTHKGFVDVTHHWQEKELLPYKLFSQVKHVNYMVMTSHIVNRQLDPTGSPTTFSKAITTELLKNEIGFSGAVITDDLQMSAISQHYDEALIPIHALNAGADLLLFGNQLSSNMISAQSIIHNIKQGVQRGDIQLQRIDDAYRKVQALKSKL